MSLSAQAGRAGLPAHEVVYRDLRDLVLFGDLAPGEPVTIQGLVTRLGVGMTPVREALRRLTAEGALESLGNRRIQVPVLDADAVEIAHPEPSKRRSRTTSSSTRSVTWITSPQSGLLPSAL